MTFIHDAYKPKAMNRKRGASLYLSLILFSVGFFIVLNLPILGDGTKNFRILDFVGFISVFYLIFAANKYKLSPFQWLSFFLCALGLTLVFINALYDVDSARQNIIVRFVLSIATGVTVASLAVRYQLVTTLAIGAWCGAFVACLIAYGQSIGVAALIAMAPIDRVESAIHGVMRPSAIWGHPNAAAQNIMAGAVMALIAWDKRNATILLSLMLYVLIIGLNYSVMQNRAPFLVGSVICLLATIRHPQLYMRMVSALCVVSVVVILMLEPQILIGERWTATFSGLSTAEQAVQRIRSTLVGLSIAMEAPLGHSIPEREALMISATGIRASHNGYIFSALVIGPWLTFTFIWIFLAIFLSRTSWGETRNFRLAIGSILLMLFFEDAIFEPTILTLLVLIAYLKHLSAKDKNLKINGKISF